MISCAMTDVGQIRSVNQDYVYATTNKLGNLPNLFLVADGMGGHKAGELASQLTVEEVTRSVTESKEKEPIQILKTAIESANAALLQKASESEEYEGMGTTLVAATIIEHTIYVGNVGDSRLYVCNKSITQITKDHSLVEEMVSLGEIDKEAARAHEKRNVITRAVGAHQHIIADFFEVELVEDDIILLCSDGLTSMLEDNDMIRIINAESDLSEVANQLITAANNNGGKDNIAVVLIKPDFNEVNLC